VFQQVGETGKRAGGSGLGLAIVQQLVTLHGGTVTVASVLGEGTTMTTLWPVATRSSERHGITPVDGAVPLPREEMKGAAEWIGTDSD
jgi:K+-sensing histidine kinase KdpD